MQGGSGQDSQERALMDIFGTAGTQPGSHDSSSARGMVEDVAPRPTYVPVSQHDLIEAASESQGRSEAFAGSPRTALVALPTGHEQVLRDRGTSPVGEKASMRVNNEASRQIISPGSTASTLKTTRTS